MKVFPAVRIEGGLFAPDLLDQLLAGDLPRQKPEDFGITGGQTVTDEIATVFTHAQAFWQAFQSRLERLPESDIGTTITRDIWVVPLLTQLDYKLSYNRRAFEVGDMTFAISHVAGDREDAPPVHIVGFRQELGRVAESGRPRLSPHSLVQEFLNCTDRLWGLVTNGRTLRLLRDSTYIRRQCYVEFDLAAIFEQHLFQDFAVLYRLLHRSRLPTSAADADQCVLEKYYQQSVEQGGRVRDHLRDGVEECLKLLANGFLRHPANHELRRCVALPDGAPELYHQLLRLVYRFLFLFVSEDRGLISNHPLYREHYGVLRLRRVVDHRSSYDEFTDVWHSLRALWLILAKDEPIQALNGRTYAELLGAPVLNGELFESLLLDDCVISNRDLLSAIWHLIYYQESPTSPPRRVNYAALDVEELGSVYESLLDYHPQINTASNPPTFDLAFGSERKSTGSYYTPAELVAELIRSALEPVLKERLAQAKTRPEKEQAILSLKVLDPACGSGHFLLAAARRLGKEVARIRTGEEEPAPEQVREAVRDVVSHCIYGVDKNPLAVELCRVALWIEAHTRGKPLTFLNHRIRCGDSLVGVFDLRVLQEGIPDAAFEPVSGDDRSLAQKLKRQNARERKDAFLPLDLSGELSAISSEVRDLEAIPDDSIQAVRQKQNRFKELQERTQSNRLACHLWTAAFFQPKESHTPAPTIITTYTLRQYLNGQSPGALVISQVEALAERHRFFHWPVEFPEVFAPSDTKSKHARQASPPSSSGKAALTLSQPQQSHVSKEAQPGGFHVVLGNPPWDQVQFDDREFFKSLAPQITDADNMAERKRLIAQLREKDTELYGAYRDRQREHDCLKNFIHASGRFPLTSYGRLNLAPLFAELARQCLNTSGRAGLVLPTGIATDAFNQYFFADLVDSGGLVSLFDFENRDAIFPHVHRSYKFSLLTMTRREQSDKMSPDRAGEGDALAGRFAFFCTRAKNLDDDRRVFILSPQEIARINPNTRTLPVFRTRQDAELTKAIYARVPVLVNEQSGQNPWGVRFLRMFDMSNDSHLFQTCGQLQKKGLRQVGNRFVEAPGGGKSSPGKGYLPLYEAKMIWRYDHRFGTYEGVTSRSSTHLPTPDENQHADPAFLAQPVLGPRRRGRATPRRLEPRLAPGVQGRDQCDQ